uniref:Uncharacterized protein n=1 Tax=Chenopodium quinoa TaxID=63459 RepID=A0A803N1D3_CHEQI
MKASLKGKYEYETDKAATSATSTLAFPVGDFKLRASVTDATFVKGPSFNGLGLSLEKPGFFIVDYNVPKKFMNSVSVLEKRLNMTYIHNKNDNRTLLDGTLVLDSSNKVSANHMLGSRYGKFRRVYGDDVLKASYQTSNQILGLDWSRNSKTNGCFKGDGKEAVFVPFPQDEHSSGDSSASSSESSDEPMSPLEDSEVVERKKME